MIDPYAASFLEPSGDLRLLYECRDPDRRSRTRWAVFGSIAAHVFVLLIGPQIPAGSFEARPRPNVEIVPHQRSTPLIAPLMPKQELTPLTQKDPNPGKPSSQVSLADLMPQPKLAPQPEPSRPAAMPALPARPPGAPAATPIEAPKIELPKTEVSQLAGLPAQGIPPASLPPPEKPKLTFEQVGAPKGTPTGVGLGNPRLVPGKGIVDEAGRVQARPGLGGGLTVGDVDDAQRGVSEMLGQAARPGGSRSALQLLSDPQGIDFKPYLTQVLAAVRRNWMAVMPESARYGRRGRTILVFSIDRAGAVPKLVISQASGTEGLDRAAVAGISASVYFPPLPAEFKGSEIRLQFVFSYNMPVR